MTDVDGVFIVLSGETDIVSSYEIAKNISKQTVRTMLERIRGNKERGVF
jgi:2-keto-3-deoxy-L-rhamnonate aldolase RhmA